MIEVCYKMGRDEKWFELLSAVRGCYVDKGLEIGINPVFTSGPLVCSDLGYHKNLCGGGDLMALHSSLAGNFILFLEDWVL